MDKEKGMVREYREYVLEWWESAFGSTEDDTIQELVNETSNENILIKCNLIHKYSTNIHYDLMSYEDFIIPIEREKIINNLLKE